MLNFFVMLFFLNNKTVISIFFCRILSVEPVKVSFRANFGMLVFSNISKGNLVFSHILQTKTSLPINLHIRPEEKLTSFLQLLER